MTNKELHEMYVRQLRALGSELVKNAEKYAGPSDRRVTVKISTFLDPDIKRPELSVTTTTIVQADI